MSQTSYNYSRYAPMGAVEEYETAREAKKGDRRAKEKLIRHNLRWILAIANHYQGAAPNIEFDDLVQAGALGIIRAAEKFDPGKGRFTTFSRYWILQSMRRLNQNASSAIRVPVHSQEDLARIRKTISMFQQENGRKPTQEELSKLTDLTHKQLERVQRSFIAAKCFSLDAPITNSLTAESVKTLGESIADPSVYEAPDDLMANAVSKLLRISSLNDREKQALRLAYGFDRGDGRTCLEVAREMGISRSRADQLIKSGIRKIRNYAHTVGVTKDVLESLGNLSQGDVGCHLGF